MKDPKQDPAFYSGRGPGRGQDIADGRGAPKSSGRGNAGQTPMPIDLGNLNQPGTGPVNFAPKKGTCFDQPMATSEDLTGN